MFRCCGEELQARSWRPDSEYYYGHERQDEDQGEEQTRDLWAHQGGFYHQQSHSCSADEDHQAERVGRHLQMVREDHHHRCHNIFSAPSASQSASSLFLLIVSFFVCHYNSRLCTRTSGKGQDGIQWSICHCSGGQDQEADQDHLRQPQSCLGGEIPFVSLWFVWLLNVRTHRKYCFLLKFECPKLGMGFLRPTGHIWSFCHPSPAHLRSIVNEDMNEKVTSFIWNVGQIFHVCLLLADGRLFSHCSEVRIVVGSLCDPVKT